MNETERRYTRGLVEVRSAGDGLSAVGGYAAKFNRLSQNLGGFVERLDPGFFNKSASDGWPDVLARYNHDDNMLLGTSAANTLTLRVDETGLDYTVHPPKHRSDVVELIQRGDVRQSSFAFRLPDGGDDWGMTEQGFPLRTLVTGRLVDVAPVNSPAYLDTTTGLRSLASHLDVDPAEVEQAAAEGELRRFFSGPPPKVFDLAGRASTSADESVLEADLQRVVANMSPDEVDALGSAAEDAVAEALGRSAGEVRGSRFDALVAKLAAKGAKDPRALAAYIGRKKYGRKAFAAMAHKGRSAVSRDELRAAVDTLTSLSPDAKESLGQVLQLIAAADNAVDVAQDVLADLLGVPNPDDDTVAPDADEAAEVGTGRSIGQGATHPGIAIRQRRAELLMRRLSPLEQGATHSAPSDHTNETE